MCGAVRREELGGKLGWSGRIRRGNIHSDGRSCGLWSMLTVKLVPDDGFCCGFLRRLQLLLNASPSGTKLDLARSRRAYLE